MHLSMQYVLLTSIQSPRFWKDQDYHRHCRSYLVGYLAKGRYGCTSAWWSTTKRHGCKEALGLCTE